MSQGTGVGTLKRYNNMLADYGDFGAMQRIAYATVSGSSASVTFSNIPSGYQDLFIVANVQGVSTGPGNTYIQFNSDITGGTTNYSNTPLYGNGSTAASTRYTNNGWIYLDTYGIMRSTAPSSLEIHILNYANSSTYKTTLNRAAADNNGSGETVLNVGLWRNTASINLLKISSVSMNFASNSTFTLYGIRAGNS